MIENALVGLQAQSSGPGQPSARTRWCERRAHPDCFTAGLYTENYRIKATNLLVTDAGQYSVVPVTVANYHFVVRRSPVWDFGIHQDQAFLLTNTDSSTGEECRAGANH